MAMFSPIKVISSSLESMEIYHVSVATVVQHTDWSELEFLHKMHLVVANKNIAKHQ